jgi:hypothetical protein
MVRRSLLLLALLAIVLIGCLGFSGVVDVDLKAVSVVVNPIDSVQPLGFIIDGSGHIINPPWFY